MEHLFALMLVFSPDASHSTNERYAVNLDWQTCNEAQQAIWALPAETVGYDEEGRAVPEFDAFCVEMSAAPAQTILNYSAN